MDHLRPEVVSYARQMEIELRANDTEKGVDGWKDCSPQELLHHLREEVAELAEAVKAEKPASEILEEAADIGNLAMMVADVCGSLALVPVSLPPPPKIPLDPE